MPLSFDQFFTDATGTPALPEPVADSCDDRLTTGEQRLVAALVVDGLSIQNRFHPEPRYEETGKGYFESRSVEEIQAAKKKRDAF